MKWQKSAVLALAVGLVSAVGYFRYQMTPHPEQRDKNKRAIGCIGDSITYGAGVAGKRKTCSYPALLSKELGGRYQVINYGASGRTLLSTGDAPYTKEKCFVRSRTDENDIYILMLGTNDSKAKNWRNDGYRTELGVFLDSYLLLRNAPKVFIMLPPKAFPGKEGKITFDIDEHVISAEIIPIIKEVAASRGVETIDLHSLTGNHPEWFADGVHPNETGNRQIAKAIAEHIRMYERGQA